MRKRGTGWDGAWARQRAAQPRCRPPLPALRRRYREQRVTAGRWKRSYQEQGHTGSILHGDIARQDFMDTRDSPTLNTITAFQRFSESCSSARFLMSTHADVLTNTPDPAQLLLQLNSSESVFTACPLIDDSAHPGCFDRKRFISHQERPFQPCPPCCSGPGYVLDGKLALRTELMGHVKPLKFEDVCVGICNILKVNIALPRDAEQFFLYEIDFDICKYRRLIAVHGLTSSELIQFWQDLSPNTSKPCL
ncbi:LOW QUALITY PROTEIN: UDP-GalNAc:beta-1,3-N-acetylgalactosaminyltransferase 1 [Passerculus sandwichensis]